MQFTAEELNLMRQWFNAIEDLAPEYLEQADRDLMQKIAKVWYDQGARPSHAGQG